MTTELFCGWIAFMLEDMELAPATVNIRVRTVRAFLRYAYEDKGWIAEPVHKRFKPVNAPIDNVEAFTPDEVKNLFASIDDDTYTGFRTKVIAFVLLDTMVRVAELVEMKRTNLDMKAGTIMLVEATETKTRITRTVPLSPKTLRILNEYLAETADFDSEYLFLSYEGKPITPATGRDNLALYGKVAGIKDKRVSPYTFRHTAALFYILNGGDPFSLQKILGHSHMNMVRRYIQMSNIYIKTQHHVFSPLNYVYK
ncbi:tyrosine-type recombinase/integrase [Peribacillus sp. SCS-26]|uniref:tyrosine-type recombinase/integrase n=1 Tax=Paraperibacillus marinus TaxID=3115295 RepID=UPI00390696AE